MIGRLKTLRTFIVSTLLISSISVAMEKNPVPADSITHDQATNSAAQSKAGKTVLPALNMTTEPTASMPGDPANELAATGDAESGAAIASNNEQVSSDHPPITLTVPAVGPGVKSDALDKQVNGSVGQAPSEDTTNQNELKDTANKDASVHTPQTGTENGAAPSSLASEGTNVTIQTKDKAESEDKTSTDDLKATKITVNETEPKTSSSATEKYDAPKPFVLDMNSEEQKRSYASGVGIAKFINNQIAIQKTVHITLNKELLLRGIIDTLDNKQQLNEDEVKSVLSGLDEEINVLLQNQHEKRVQEDNAFLHEYVKKTSVSKSKKGFYYTVINKGEGPIIKDRDMIELSYKATLTNGTVVDKAEDNSTENFVQVKDLTEFMRDSVKQLREGGEIQVILPSTYKDGSSDNKSIDFIRIYNIVVEKVKAQD